MFVLALLVACAYAGESKIRKDVNYLLFVTQNNNHMFPPTGHVIHQDIFDAYHRGIVEKHGNPGHWHETHPLWHKRHILRFGHQRISGRAGLKVNVPQGYDTLWVRVLNDRWFHMRIRGFEDHEHSEVERYATGHRCLNEFSPDGAAPDSYHRLHMWVNVPLRYPGAYLLISEIHSDSWISGVAFTTNPWNHARNSAVAYHWGVNGGDKTIWNTHNWNNDQLSRLHTGRVWTMKVPVIYSGRDKLVYIVEHNNNWVGTMHAGVRIGGESIERFRTTYANPFATHYNSKIYDRYIAARVPAHLIQPGQKFLELRVDMTMSDHHIHFREIGSHDFF